MIEMELNSPGKTYQVKEQWAEVMEVYQHERSQHYLECMLFHWMDLLPAWPWFAEGFEDQDVAGWYCMITIGVLSIAIITIHLNLALTFTRQQHEAVMAFTTKHSDSRSLGFLSSCWLLVWICEYLLYQDLPQYGLTCTHGVSVILYSTFIGLNDLTKTYFKKNNLNLSEA